MTRNRWSATQLPATENGRCRVAATNTDPEVLAALGRDPSKWVRKKVLYNPLCPVDVLVAEAASEDIGIRVAVARHPSLPSEVARLLSADPVEVVRRSIAWNTSAPAEVLTVLAGDAAASVRSGAARNANLPAEEQLRFLSDPDEAVSKAAAWAVGGDGRPVDDRVLRALLSSNAANKRRAAQFPELPAWAWRELIAEPGDGVAFCLFRHRTVGVAYTPPGWQPGDVREPTFPADVAASAAVHPDERVRKMLASGWALSPEILTVLANDPAIPVRQAVARHPATPSASLAKLLTGRSSFVREAVLSRRYPVDGVSSVSQWVITHPDSKVRRVAAQHWSELIPEMLTDPDPDVRAVIAKRFAPSAYVHDPSSVVRKALAAATTDPEVLHQLVVDPAVHVRRAVVRSRYLAAADLPALIGDVDETVREAATSIFTQALIA